MTPEEMESSWQLIERPASPVGINGRRAPGLPAAVAAYLAVDGQAHRHLLARVPDKTNLIKHRETRGLLVRQARYSVGSNPEALYIDLECSNTAQHATFSAFASDLLRSLALQLAPVAETVADTLARWHAFWRVQSDAMTQDELRGVFGELWFILHWLKELGPKSVLAWQATNGAIHDFQWPTASLEIKASAAGPNAMPVHRISSLDQLVPPQQGQLYLFSLHLREDLMSQHSLDGLVDELTERFKGSWPAIDHLNSELANRGYSPGVREHETPLFRVLGQRLYRVDEGFPRLTAASLRDGHAPPGVSDVQYSIDTAVCTPWLVADSPDCETVRRLMKSIVA